MKQNRSIMTTGVAVSLLMGMVLCFFSFLESAPAEEGGGGKENIYYIVREGDCLWTISDRFYEDPFLWPFVWQNNPYIANPHWIYPGDRIFLAEVGKEGSRVGAPLPQGIESPVPTLQGVTTLTIPKNLADTALISETGLVPLGWVLSSRDGRTLLAEGDELILEMPGDSAAPVGEKFQVVRKVREIRHPKTRERLGNLVRLMGYVETTGPQNEGMVPARVLLSNNGLQAGDMVTQGMRLPPSGFFSKPALRSLQGCIVASLNNTIGIAQYDVCFIDRGLADGVEVGDSFWIMNPGSMVKSHGEQRKVKTPDMKIGTLVVLSAEKHVSTALVTESDAPFDVGASVSSWTE